jgi:hypothetical protein
LSPNYSPPLEYARHCFFVSHNTPVLISLSTALANMERTTARDWRKRCSISYALMHHDRYSYVPAVVQSQEGAINDAHDFYLCVHPLLAPEKNATLESWREKKLRTRWLRTGGRQKRRRTIYATTRGRAVALLRCRHPILKRQRATRPQHCCRVRWRTKSHNRTLKRGGSSNAMCEIRRQ